MILRPSGDTTSPPFDAWQYQPAYLPSPLAIHVARDMPLTEPAFFHLPFVRREARLGANHEAAARRVPLLSRVTICGPRRAASAPALAVAAGGWLTFEGAAGAHTMTLVLDGGQRDERVDLRPELPVVLQWRWGQSL